MPSDDLAHWHAGRVTPQDPDVDPARAGRALLLRTAARVLLLDGAGRVLLMRGFDPADPGRRRYWFTVGGGTEPGERLHEAAVRELHEETGLAVAHEDLHGPVWHEVVEFGFEQWWVRQSQEYFVVRLPGGPDGAPAWQPAPAALEPSEVATVDRWAWWSVEQLRAHAQGTAHDGPGEPDELTYPPELPDLVERHLGGGNGRR